MSQTRGTLLRVVEAAHVNTGVIIFLNLILFPCVLAHYMPFVCIQLVTVDCNHCMHLLVSK